MIEGRQRIGGYSGLPALISQLGVDPASVLASAGLSKDALDDPDGNIPYSAVGRLLNEAALRTDCPHFGILAGRIWRLDDFGLPGELARHSPTVGEGLRTLTVYQHLNSGGALAYLIENERSVDFGYAIYQPGVSGSDQLCDAALAGGVNILRALCGPDWVPSDVLLSRAKPADGGPYQHAFKVQPRFNSETSALRFPARWMRQPVDQADAALLQLARQRADMAGSADLLQRVYRALRLLMLRGDHSGDALAQTLSMHRRTLNRRLKVEGTTFRQVLDEVRFEVARQLLSGAEISLDDVAAALGYASISPFMRAFRRWCGATPDQWRRAAASRPQMHPRPEPRIRKQGSRAEAPRTNSE